MPPKRKQTSEPGATKRVTKKAKVEAEAVVVPKMTEVEQTSDFAVFKQFINSMCSTTKTNAKQDILAKYPQCQKLLLYTYHPNWQYGVTSKNVQKLAPKLSESDLAKEFDDVFQLLDALKSDELTGHAAIASVLRFVKSVGEENASVMDLIIDRNLEIRCNIASINKVFIDLIPIFEVPLATEFDPEWAEKYDWQGPDSQHWYSSQKLDGVRVVVVIGEKPEDIVCYSREGNPFVSLSKVQDAFKKLELINVVFDGELCVLDEDGRENFKKAVSEVKRKSKQVEAPRYKVFDIVPLADFNKGYSAEKYSSRIAKLQECIGTKAEPVITLVEQTLIKNKEHLDELIAESKEKQWEGLILRLDGPFEAKRSKNMLKVKQFHDQEFVVQSIETGEMRFVEDVTKEDGTVEHVEVAKQNLLASVVILLDNKHPVNVGSGFTKDERVKFVENPDLIVGKRITVQYFERTEDANGKPSLRFPTFKGLRPFM
uniref:DNA ligase n=1 Tax=Clandestinovirus TaxID=2831644 RepID=A0A8F8KLH2_9VIRU|nr:ATP-dependent DNA ligase [Clandestinovirus]